MRAKARNSMRRGVDDHSASTFHFPSRRSLSFQRSSSRGFIERHQVKRAIKLIRSISNIFGHHPLTDCYSNVYSKAQRSHIPRFKCVVQLLFGPGSGAVHLPKCRYHFYLAPARGPSLSHPARRSARKIEIKINGRQRAGWGRGKCESEKEMNEAKKAHQEKQNEKFLAFSFNRRAARPFASADCVRSLARADACVGVWERGCEDVRSLLGACG